jgi:hypothetical protein
MVTGSQEIEASLFCGNSEFDEVRNRELLVGKHESHHFAAEYGSGFVRLFYWGFAVHAIRRFRTCARPEANGRHSRQDGGFHPSPTTQKPEFITCQKGRAMPAYSFS